STSSVFSSKSSCAPFPVLEQLANVNSAIAIIIPATIDFKRSVNIFIIEIFKVKKLALLIASACSITSGTNKGLKIFLVHQHHLPSFGINRFTESKDSPVKGKAEILFFIYEFGMRYFPL